MIRKYVIVVLLVCAAFISCENKDCAGSSSLVESTEIVLGDGSVFYNEVVSIGGTDFFVHHSTLKCPAIKNGVQRNCYKLNGYNNIFCSCCMNDYLITTFNNRFFPNGYKM